MLETILTYLAPALTAIVGWLAGNQKRKNDFLNDLQASIDLLADKNKSLLAEVVKLRSENATLIANQDAMQYRIDELTKQNALFQKEIQELNARLENVKTITKKI